MLRGPYLYAARVRLLNPVSTQILRDPKLRLGRGSFDNYDSCWKALQARFPEHRINDFTEADFDAFFTYADAEGTVRRVIGEPGWLENTVDQYIKAFRFAFQWAHRKGVIERDPTVYLRVEHEPKAPGRTHRRGNWLTLVEVAELTDLISAGEDPFAFRDRVLCQFIVGTGLRASEAAAVVWNDLQFDGAVTILHVNRGKGDKYRQLSPTPRTLEALAEWRRRAETLAGRPILDAEPLFPRARGFSVNGQFKEQSRTRRFDWGSSIGYSGVKGIVTAAGARIGRPALRPHDLRRTYAGLLEDAGLDIRTISKNLGHESVATTETYLSDNPTKRAAAVAGLTF